MRELLIRYLLGELDYDERAALQARLKDSPELRRELSHLKSCFATNGNDEFVEAEPPGGLAERTAQQAANLADDDVSSLVPQRASTISAVNDPPVGGLGWSLADLTVAGGVILAMSMMVFPALRDSLYATRLNTCQDHLRRMGMKFMATSTSPKIGRGEAGGYFVTQMVEDGLIDPDEVPDLFFCPGAPLADEVRAGNLTLRYYPLSELNSMSLEKLALERKLMSPFYAPRFPFQSGGQLHYISNGRSHKPIVGDAPVREENGSMTFSHGHLTLVLFQDGSVGILRTRIEPDNQDDIFLNGRGKIEAGVDEHDTVLGPSDAVPAP